MQKTSKCGKNTVIPSTEQTHVTIEFVFNFQGCDFAGNACFQGGYHMEHKGRLISMTKCDTVATGKPSTEQLIFCLSITLIIQIVRFHAPASGELASSQLTRKWPQTTPRSLFLTAETLTKKSFSLEVLITQIKDRFNSKNKTELPGLTSLSILLSLILANSWIPIVK